MRKADLVCIKPSAYPRTVTLHGHLWMIAETPKRDDATVLLRSVSTGAEFGFPRDIVNGC